MSDHEGARARRRRIREEEERWAEEAWREYEQTEEGSQVCRWVTVPPEPER